MNKFLSGLKALVCASAALLCGGAWAATPVAVWNGDLTASIKGGYKLSLESGATAGQNGVVNAAKNTGTATEGLKITCGADISPSAKDFSTPKTIAVKYSGLDKTGQNDVFLALERSDGSELLIYFKGNNLGLASPNSTSGNILGQTAYTPPVAGVMMISTSGAGTKITCQPTSGAASTYELTTSDDAKVSSISAIRIGGAKVRINWYYRPGMTIEAVAVFNGIVDSADIDSIDWTATATSNASCVNYTNMDKGLTGDSNAGAVLSKLILYPLDGLCADSVVRVKSIAIGKRTSGAASIPHHLELAGVNSTTATEVSINNRTMEKFVFDTPVCVKVGTTGTTLVSRNADGTNASCGFNLYQASSEIDAKYKAVYCDWLGGNGKNYTIPYVIELEEYTYLKYANSTASLVYGDGTTASPKAGDTIVIDDSHYTDIWKVGNHSEFTTFPVLDQCKLVLYSRMNLYHSIAANQKVEVNADTYLYGNVGAGVVISGKGNFDIGYSGNSSTIGNGVIIGSKTFTINTGKTAEINGSVMITSSTISIADNGALVLNTADASITAPSALTSAKISSSVEGKEVKSFDNQDGTVTYSLKDAPVATVYGVVYTSLKLAIEAADAGATITLLRDGTLEINEPISKALTISAAAAKTLTLVPGGDKKYVSASDIKNLTLGTNVSLAYDWEAEAKVVSINFHPGANNNTGTMPDTTDIVMTMAGKVSNNSWNNMTDGTSSTARNVTKLYNPTKDGDDKSETISGLTATYTGRAYYSGNNSNNANPPFMKGYIDDNASNKVRVMLSGIPFSKYDIIVYMQGDTTSHSFCPIEIIKGSDATGVTYGYNNDMQVVSTGYTASWGGANQTTFSYDKNVIRICGLGGSSVTIASTLGGGSARGTIAAIQIVQMSTDEEDNAVAQIGEKYYGTLAAALGEATSGQTIKLLKNVALESATTLPTGTNLEILEDVELDTAGFTFTGELNGSGKIIYHGAGTAPNYTFPANPTLGNDWTGICSFTDFCTEAESTNGDDGGVRFYPDNFANENSKIEFNGIKCFVWEGEYKAKEIIITDNGSVPGLVIRNGWSDKITTFKKLSGTGTIFSNWPGDQRYVFKSGADFDGNITIGRNNSTRCPKIIFGTGTLPAQSQTGPQIFVLSGAEVTMPAIKNWSAKEGIKVDGTLNFAAETSGTARFFSSPLSGSGTINLASPGSGQTKIVFTNAAQAFVGSIAAKQHAHFVFAAANKSSTGMSFNNSGYVCVETGSATLAAGKAWSGAGSSGYGVFVENQNSSPATLNLEGDATITGKLFVRSGANLKFLNYGTMTVSGNIEPANATINVTLPVEAPAGDLPKKLLGWNSLSSGVTFNCTTVPEGFLLTTKDDGLYLEAQADITTSVENVANNVATAGYISLGQGGVYTVTGKGGLTINILNLKEGSKLVFDPVRTPILAKDFAVLGNATIKLQSTWTDHTSEYAEIECGKIHLLTYPNTFEIDTSRITIEGLKNGVSATLSIVDIADSNYKQLVLDVGNFAANGRTINISQFGDSITEGIWRSGPGTPNYRIPLMHRLEAHGYKPISYGYRGDAVMNDGGRVWGSSDANGVPADPNYRLHNGISAQRVYTGTRSGAIRAGFNESLEAHLEQVGIPDVITLKIGTNDLIGGQDGTVLYEGWSNLVARIVANRPTTRVVVTTVLKAQNAVGGYNNLNGEDATTYNEKITAAVNNKIFGKNQVFLADLRTAVGDHNGTDFVDQVHPNWSNYNVMADTLFPVVTNAFATSTGKAHVPHTVRGAEANVPASYRKGFVKLASFDAVTGKMSEWTSGVPYTYANMPESVNLKKVAYYVERKTNTSPDNRFVWVDMDPWKTNLKASEAGIAVAEAQRVNTVIDNLHVYSNNTGIKNIEPTVSGTKGTLLFTDKYLGIAGQITTTGFDSVYGFDYNDTLDSGSDWGAMIVSRVDPDFATTSSRQLKGETLFSFNGYNAAATKKNMLGIGSFAVHGPMAKGNDATLKLTMNWMFDKNENPQFTRMTADNLDFGTIEVWGVPEGYVVPDSEETIEVSAESAAAAIESAQIMPDTAAETAAGSAATRESYLTFTATRVGESNNWKVQAVVDNTKLPENKKIDDTAVAFANAGGIVKLAGATEKQTIQIPKANVTPGLYYSVSFGTTPDNHEQESERVLATSGEGTVDIPVPALGNEKVYYIKVKASATK